MTGEGQHSLALPIRDAVSLMCKNGLALPKPHGSEGDSGFSAKLLWCERQSISR
jgi:hypothetical protein